MSKFPENLEYNYAAKFKKELEKLLKKGDSVFIDLENVERASLACIQLLVAAHQKAAKKDMTLLIKSSEALDQMLEDLGFNTIIQTERAA